MITKTLLNKVYVAGYEAYAADIDKNPYSMKEAELHEAWMDGWWDAYNDDEWLREIEEEEYANL